MSTLSRLEVLNLEAAMLATFAAHITVRATHPLAKRIKFPGIPAPFSESIVVLAASKLFPQYRHYTASAGGKQADVILSPPPRGAVVQGNSPPSIVMVEVKATASRGTLELKTRDVQADFLVWLAFGNRFEGGGDPISVHVVPSPKTNACLQAVARRVVKLPAFIAAAGHSPGYRMDPYPRLDQLI